MKMVLFCPQCNKKTEYNLPNPKKNKEICKICKKNPYNYLTNPVKINILQNYINFYYNL